MENRVCHHDFLTSSSTELRITEENTWNYGSKQIFHPSSHFCQIFSHRNIKLSLMGNETWVPYTRGVSGVNLVLFFPTMSECKAPLFLWDFLWKEATDSAWPSGSSLTYTTPKPLSAMNHICSLEECWTKCYCISFKENTDYPFSADILRDWNVVLITNHFRGNHHCMLVHTLYFSQIWISGEELEHLRSRIKIKFSDRDVW